MQVDVHDPYADAAAVQKEYGIGLIAELNTTYDAVILAVAHKEYRGLDIKKLIAGNSVVFDTKAIIDRKLVDGRL